MAHAPRPAARAILALSVVLAPHVLGAQGGGTQRSSWLATALAEQGYDSNVRYDSDSAKISDYNRRVTGSFQATRVRARSTLAIQANGAIVRYQELKALNAVSFDINPTATRRVSANTSASVGAFYRNVLSSETVLTPTSLLFRRAMQKSIGGTVGAIKKFSPFNTGTIDVGYTSVTFDRPGLIPGSSFTARGQFGHALRTRGALGIVADMSQGDAQGIRLGTQTLGALYAPKFGKTIKVAIIAGATRTVTDSASLILPSGSVQVGDSVGPGSLSVGYSRGASQAFGLGSLLVTDAVSAAYDFQALRGNFVTLGGWWGQSKPSSGSGITLKSRSAFASFRRVLKGGITLGGTGSYRQRKDLIAATGFAAQLGVGFSLRPR
jgi:hypothetical protein